MSAWRTALGGMLGLALLDAAVSSQQAAGRVGGLFTAVAAVVDHVLSPTVPAIPDLRSRSEGTVREYVPPGAACCPRTGPPKHPSRSEEKTMFKTYMKYSAVLIGVYLLVTHASGAGTVFTQGAAGVATIDKTLQGR